MTFGQQPQGNNANGFNGQPYGQNQYNPNQNSYGQYSQNPYGQNQYQYVCAGRSGGHHSGSGDILL